MKASELLRKNQCGVKYTLSLLDGKKEKNFFNTMALKHLFKEYGIEFTDDDIQEALKKIPSSLFLTKREEDLNKSILKDKLNRFKEWYEISYSSKKVARKADVVEVIINGEPIGIDFHLILESDDVVEVVKFKNKKIDITKSGKNRPNTNPELFLLQKVGESLYPTKTVYGEIIFLTSKDDSGEILSEKFEEKPLQNIAAYHFSDEDYDKMQSQLEKAVISKGKCDGSQCKDCGYINICNYTHHDFSELEIAPAIKKASSRVSFTEAQEEFINIENGVYRVLAGAGSGKTTVLANRVVNLIKMGYSPSEILLTTYTSAGVKEIEEKIAYWLRENDLDIDMDAFNIYTFNGFGYELIKKEYKSLGFTKEPTVIDRITKIEIIKEILDDMPKISCLNYVYPFMDLFAAKGAVIQVCEDIDKIKSAGYVYPDELAEENGISMANAELIFKACNMYNERLKVLNMVDFTDQISMMFDILSEPKNIEKYGFEHIIVDEFQDSDSVQINLISLMKDYKYNKSLAVLGDDSQAIYSWRGANQYNIINFKKYFEDVRDIKMVDNFRSTKEIITFANYLNSINKNRVDKELKSSAKGEMPTVEVGGIDDVVNNVEMAAKDLKYENLNKLAVLTRTKGELIEIQAKLKAKGIPSVISVGENLIDNHKIKNLIGFSNFLVDDSLDLHFAEYLQVVKNKEFEKVLGTDMFFDFIKNEKKNFMLKYGTFSTDIEKIHFFYEILDSNSSTDKALAALLKVLKDRNFRRLNDLVNFLNILIPYKADFFLDKPQENYNAVVLTTAHSSKGREFDTVYLLLNKFKYTGNEIVDEEERRVLFVGATRAKEKLKVFGEARGKSGAVFKEFRQTLNKVKAKIA